MERFAFWMTVIVFGGGTLAAVCWGVWALIKPTALWALGG